MLDVHIVASRFRVSLARTAIREDLMGTDMHPMFDTPGVEHKGDLVSGSE